MHTKRLAWMTPDQEIRELNERRFYPIGRELYILKDNLVLSFQTSHIRQRGVGIYNFLTFSLRGNQFLLISTSLIKREHTHKDPMIEMWPCYYFHTEEQCTRRWIISSSAVPHKRYLLAPRNLPFLNWSVVKKFPHQRKNFWWNASIPNHVELPSNIVIFAQIA